MAAIFESRLFRIALLFWVLLALFSNGGNAHARSGLARRESHVVTEDIRLLGRQGFDDDGDTGDSGSEGGGSDTDGGESGTDGDGGSSGSNEPYCDGTEADGNDNCVVSGSPQDCEENDEDCPSVISNTGSGGGGRSGGEEPSEPDEPSSSGGNGGGNNSNAAANSPWAGRSHVLAALGVLGIFIFAL